MIKNEKIFEEMKSLLYKISSIVFINPFSVDRLNIDKEITGVFDLSELSSLLPHLIKTVSGKLKILDQAGYVSFLDFKKPDQQMMRHVYLFETYHAYINDFDKLIKEQTNLKDTVQKVEFASAILIKLLKRGFTQEEAIHYVSIFYQLRRAFYFINSRLVGCSVSMQKLRISLWHNVFTHNIFFYEKYLISNMEDFSTLILGETGSGKGAVASSIGCCGYIGYDEKKKSFGFNFMNQFISVNLSQYSEGLLESELFGHKKGAFTGAISDHEGVFARCSREGAIFLDEIGEVNVSTQIKLLKVLQERSFTKVGDYQDQRFSGRVIAATNQDIEKLLEAGKFREDFYYRLCSDVIKVPSLNQRIKEDPEELRVMLENVIGRITKEKNADLLENCLKKIKAELGLDYAWPGNVRELEQCARSIFINDKCHRPLSKFSTKKAWSDQMLKGELSSQELLSHYCSLLYEKEKSYEKVAKITALDRRTVKKYIDENKT